VAVADPTGAALRAQLESWLRPDEQLLWCGRPDPSVLFTAADSFVIPFTILWLAFALFWEHGVSQGGDAFARVWGIPFIVIGLYMVAGRFIYKRIRKKRTAYGLTRDRAIVAVGGTLSDVPIAAAPLTISRSRDRRHVSVSFGASGNLSAGDGRRRPTMRRAYSGSAYYAGSSYYANTGLELMARGIALPVAFYDVGQPDELLAAIEQARAPAR
jgi:hypothetical protein